MQSHQIIIDILPAKPGFTQINVQGRQHIGGFFAHIHANISQPTIYRWCVNYSEHSLFHLKDNGQNPCCCHRLREEKPSLKHHAKCDSNKTGTPIVNGTQRFLALQNSKPEAGLSIAITAVQHVTLALVIKNEWVFDHLGVPAVWRYIYSCFIETEIPTCSALAVGITNLVFFARTAPVRKPHLIALIRASDNSGARKSLGRAKAVRDSKTIA